MKENEDKIFGFINTAKLHFFFIKLDSVVPLITDPPQISFTTLSEKERKKVTCDT